MRAPPVVLSIIPERMHQSAPLMPLTKGQRPVRKVAAAVGAPALPSSGIKIPDTSASGLSIQIASSEPPSGQLGVRSC